MTSFSKIRYLSKEMLNFTQKARAAGAKPVKMAVIDTGANINHPHVKNLHIKHMYNVITDEHRNDMSDPCGHGTQILSIIYQMFEDCLDCIQIVVIKAVKSTETSAALVERDFVNAICYLDKNFKDVKLVSLSAGFDLSPGEKVKLSRLVNDFTQQRILIAASSNIGYWKQDGIAYPASAAISIGSLDVQGNRSKFSPVGKDLLFMTIGEGYTVANPKYVPGSHLPEHAEVRESFGTSCATPVVACFAAHTLLQLEYHLKGLLKTTYIL